MSRIIGMEGPQEFLVEQERDARHGGIRETGRRNAIDSVNRLRGDRQGVRGAGRYFDHHSQHDDVVDLVEHLD